MSTQILIKRSTTTGAVPTTSDIAVGELAINTVDKRIFTNNSGTIVELGTTPTTQAVTGNASVGGTFDVVGAVTVGNFTADGTVDLTSATVTIPAPTADTHPATKKYVDDEVNAILAGAPAALDTLNEIAAAINDDANVYTTLTNSIATKLSLSGGTMTGSIDMGANSITTSVDPATDNTLTRKSYVDGLYQSTVDAEVSAANALASEQAAATSATNSATSATASATSATASASSATNAASSATAAATSATSSANSATASATSATQSAASATQAQALVDSIESFYLGAEASAPTVDDNGDPLQAGDWYFNTTDSQTYIYNGSSWQSVSPDLVADLTPQLGGNLDTNGNDITFGDNDKAIFGAGSDLQIFHTGSYSAIRDVGTGGLFIGGENYVDIGNAGASATYARFHKDAQVDLYHNNAIKLATTSTGIDVTGTATMDGLTVDGSTSMNGLIPLNINATTGTNYLGMKLNNTGGNSYIGLANSSGAGFISGSDPYALNIVTESARDITLGTTNTRRMNVDSGGDISFYEDTGTTAKFFWDASAESLGIGTSSPTTPLDIAGASGTTLSVRNTSTVSSILLSNGSAANQIFSRGANSSTGRDLAFVQGTSEAMRIDSSGNVGIGVTDPTYALQVNGTIAAEYTATSRVSRIVPSDTAMTYSINSNTGEHVFVSGAYERMRIDSSGNLLVGTTDSQPAGNNDTSGISLREAGTIEASRDSGPSGKFNRKTSDGSILDFAKDGTTVGSIGTRAGYLKIGSGDAGLLFNYTGNNIFPENIDTGAANDGNIDLGASTARFKDLYLSGGVYLGGTGAANHLDDYETGTWTPTLDASVGYTGMTSITSVNGDYTKVGDTVTIALDFETDSTDTTMAVGDSVTLSALPFVPRDYSGAGGNVYHIGTATVYESLGGSTWAYGFIWVDTVSYKPTIEWAVVNGSPDADREHSCVITFKTDS